MFSGIVEFIGVVVFFNKNNNSAVLGIKTQHVVNDIVIGDSIACSGVCLTVSDIKSNVLYFDISASTLASTSIGLWHDGFKVNLERSLCLGDRIGGHFVYGHVDCVGKIVSREKIGSGYVFHISIDESFEPYIVCKGALAVDGVSLTVNSIKDDILSFFIIPHTFRSTVFSSYVINSVINIEIDAMARYVIDYIRS